VIQWLSGLAKHAGFKRLQLEWRQFLDIGGNIKESTALEGDPILSAAVMDAVKQWKFAPIRWTVTPWKWFLKSRWDLVSAN